MGEVFPVNMALVSLRDLIQSPQFPSPQTSETDPLDESSDSSQSFSFSTPLTTPIMPSFLSKEFVLSLKDHDESLKRPISPLTPEDHIERKEGPALKDSPKSETSHLCFPSPYLGLSLKSKASSSKHSKLAAEPPCFLPKNNMAHPLVIRDQPIQKPKVSTLGNVLDSGKISVIQDKGKGKAVMGAEDPSYSADSDLSPNEEDLMDLDVNEGVVVAEGNLSGPSMLKAKATKKVKSVEKIAKERARRTKLLTRKKIGWVGCLWEKLKISDEKKKVNLIPQVGDKLVTIEEDSEDWVPLKKRCKFQKCFKGKNKLKYGLSGSDDVSTSSEDASAGKGEVAGPKQPPKVI